MRKFQTLKLSQFHKEKKCWTENWWYSGIMSNFWGEFFYVLGGKKNLKKKIWKHFSNRIEKLHKMALIIFFEKLWKSWKNWNYLHKILVTMYSICYTRDATSYLSSQSSDQANGRLLIEQQWGRHVIQRFHLNLYFHVIIILVIT